MPSSSMPSKLTAIALVLTGVLVGILAAPLWRLGLRTAMQDRFGHLTYLCDHAMREHLIAKQELALRPGVENVTKLKSAEVTLIDCQDYDILRKQLISWGLTDNDLSLMGLRAVEAQVSNLQRVIEIHEVRY